MSPFCFLGSIRFRVESEHPGKSVVAPPQWEHDLKMLFLSPEGFLWH